MNNIDKLIFKTVRKHSQRDPVIVRRDKLIAGLKEQKLVYAAALRSEDHHVEKHRWQITPEGARVSVKRQLRIRPWFFQQDDGWYVQCRYGARVIAADGVNNAVFVKIFKEVVAVLDVFLAAAAAGELDAAINKAAKRLPRLKPGASKDAQHG
jgi:hypothetical protein